MLFLACSRSHQYQLTQALLTNPYPFDITRATTAKGKGRGDLRRGNMPLMGGVMITPQRAGAYECVVPIFGRSVLSTPMISRL